MTDMNAVSRATTLGLAGSALGLILGAGVGYSLRDNQQATVDRQEKQLVKCEQLTTVMKSMIENAVNVVDAGDDLETLKKEQARMVTNGALMQRLFGTKRLPEAIDQCTEGVD